MVMLFCATRSVFPYDSWDYARNALTLRDLTPAIYGYAPWRPAGPTIMGAVLSWVSWSPENVLGFMRLQHAVAALSAPLVLVVLFGWLHSRGASRVQAGWCVAILGSSVLLWVSAADSLVDVPAALLGIGAAVLWMRLRGHRPRAAFWGAALGWAGASFMRHEYLAFGVVFLADEACRMVLDRERGLWRTRLAAGGLAVVIGGGAFIAPLGSPSSVMAQLEMHQKIFAGLDRGFTYDRVWAFALPSIVTIVALVGLLWCCRQIRRDASVRFLMIYLAFFLFVHLVLIPQQYVRFLAPYVLPLAFGLHEFLNRCPRSWRSLVAAGLVAACLMDLSGLIRHGAHPFFRETRAVEAARTVAEGTRAGYAGKSFPLVVPGAGDYGPGPEFTTYHFGANALRVIAGRRTFYEEGPPETWIPRQSDGTRVLFNPNTRLFYHQRGDQADPLQVLSLKIQRTPAPAGECFGCWPAGGDRENGWIVAHSLGKIEALAGE